MIVSYEHKNEKEHGNSIMCFYYKVLFKKRTIIDTVSNMFQKVCQIKHKRYFSVKNPLIGLILLPITYNSLPIKKHNLL